MLQEAEARNTASKDLTICLVGMPNAGKTTLMNALTGGNFQTANYPGVTVDLIRGRSKPEFGPSINLVDLPGVHSSVNPSPEEELACAVIEGRDYGVKPDGFILVVDATQLERHLKFAGFVAHQQRPMVIALTMVDLLPRLHQTVDVQKLEKALGVPVIPVDARSEGGIRDLVKALHEARAGANSLASLPADPVAAFDAVRETLRKSGAVHAEAKARHEIDPLTVKIDRYALHRVWGFPVFIIVLVSLFASIFWAAQPFMDLIDALFKVTGDGFIRYLGDNTVTRFIAEGLIGGVGSVAVFFPQILILFFLMSLLEDSGYLARGATLVDRPLSALGLHGRSFVPMLSGFACAIPAVFAARAIPSKRERLLTIWIIPLMSCSARLPVYALLLAALLHTAHWQAGFSLAAIYISSLLIGSIVAGLASRLVYKFKAPSLLAMELPVYRAPRWKPILRITWARGSSYLKKAGTPIVLVSAILWLLSNFGTTSPSFVPHRAEMDQSFAAQLGHRFEPVLRPMGVDWRVGVGLISAFAAREVFVSSMAIVFHVDGDEGTRQEGLLEQMRLATFPGTSQRIFTPSSIVGLIVFFFFSLQCFSTVAVVRKETGSSKIAAAQLAFYTGLGYILAVSCVQALRAVGVS